MGKEKKVGFLDEEKGVLSVRRLIAIIFTFTLVAAIILIFIFHVSWNWSVTLVVLGIPAAIIIFCVFFTTWDDISKVVSFHKGDQKIDKKKDESLDDINDATLDNKPDPNEL